MARSLIDNWIYSNYPHIILGMLFGGNPLLLVSSETPVQGYSGRLFLHATKYENDDDKKVGLAEIQTYLGFERGMPESEWGTIDGFAEVPECSLIGYCTIKVEPYNSLLYDNDYYKHNLPYSWEELYELRGWNPLTEVLGINMTDFWMVKSPIRSIRRDDPPFPRELWLPGEPIELEAMKMCLEPDRRVKAPVDFKERFLAS